MVTVACGFAGGRHRSVVLANELHTMLARHGIATQVIHADVHRPVAGSGGDR
jgi:RNase adaptor protein for sRNA GlmZ degradation